MVVLFVGDKPSKKNKNVKVPFVGAACEKRLREWVSTLGVAMPFFINQSDYTHEQLIEIANRIKIPIVALGNEASTALGNIPHFKLPHPSGRNRQINNSFYILTQLLECKLWLTAKSQVRSA